jgi:hypothetical protein
MDEKESWWELLGFMNDRLLGSSEKNMNATDTLAI